MMPQFVKYPEVQAGGNSQGVGPHYDTGFLTFVRDILLE